MSFSNVQWRKAGTCRRIPGFSTGKNKMHFCALGLHKTMGNTVHFALGMEQLFKNVSWFLQTWLCMMFPTPWVQCDIFFFMGKMRLVQTTPKILHIGNETIKSWPLENPCKWGGFYCFLGCFFPPHIREEHLESEPPTSLCSQFGKLEQMFQCLTPYIFFHFLRA